VDGDERDGDEVDGDELGDERNGHAGPSPEQVLALVGDLRQVCRIDRFVHDDGPARGSRLVRVVNGGGLEIELLPDRGLDLGHVTYRGIPLAWAAPALPAGPAHVDPHGTGWLRTFSGGLLTTCGLDQFGAPTVDQDQAFGLHGRASSLAATHLSTRAPSSASDDPELQVTAELRQASLFGENLRLERELRTRFGSASFTLEDRITNLGVDPQPHLLLYHLNLGWPLLGPGATVDVPAERTTARDADAEPGLADWEQVPEPADRYPEQVLRHDLAEVPRATVTVSNPAVGLRLRLHVDPRVLPHVFQWRLLRRGTYVLGIEPANSPAIGGRGEARAQGALPELEPGETRRYALTVEIDEVPGGQRYASTTRSSAMADHPKS
jgi:hypothetical protein